MDETLPALAALGQETRLDNSRLLVKARSEGVLARDIGQRLGTLQNSTSANFKPLLALTHTCPARWSHHPLRRGHDRIPDLLAFPMEGCWGGSAPAAVDACRVDDVRVSEKGKAGCGCSRKPAAAAAVACACCEGGQ